MTTLFDDMPASGLSGRLESLDSGLTADGRLYIALTVSGVSVTVTGANRADLLDSLRVRLGELTVPLRLRGEIYQAATLKKPESTALFI